MEYLERLGLLLGFPNDTIRRGIRSVLLAESQQLLNAIYLGPSDFPFSKKSIFSGFPVQSLRSAVITGP